MASILIIDDETSVRELLRTMLEGENQRRANGPDEISYCAENSINPDGYFTPRGTPPYQYVESATEPASWTASRVHTLWTWAMYEKQ